MSFQGLLLRVVATLQDLAVGLFLPALFFAWLAFVVKRWRAFDDARRAARETRLNLALYLLDELVVTPPLVLLVVAMKEASDALGLALVSSETWMLAGGPLALFAALFASDFIGYARHRLEHTALLWPAHVLHHSDTQMTWLAISRFHPINRLTTSIIDNAVMLTLGFPEWAIVVSHLVRSYYGMFIHADLPWTFGPLGRVFVSPVMHRWHHVREGDGVGANFATVFSVFDRAFGTYYVPSVCTAPLGVTEAVGPGVVAHLVYPFRAWARLLRGGGDAVAADRGG